ncbi:MAG: 7-cyano-7-deazaguanine synthase QueC [Muribaculaceae bacterium]|nr:7-cyano-7-deazaguanine synthase QueC [Muribaculaceae bacterium]
MRALVLFSGGVDSSTCLALAVKEYGAENVVALSVAYGQKHTKEIAAADSVAKYYKVEHIKIDLSLIFKYSNCSLLAGSTEEIPHESYARQLEKTGGSPVSTYVPFRNGLFIAAAASVAISKGCGVILYGAHADDSAGNAYPDCSPAFNEAMNKAVFEGSGGQVKISAPFVGMNKAQVVKKGLELGVPYELTWSCYEGGDVPCGVCGTCRDRAAAFAENGVTDPLNAPKSVKDVFDIMKTWKNLRGEIHIENGDCEYIVWNISDDLRIEISLDPYDGTVCVFDPEADAVDFDSTYHWHPDFCDIYRDLRDVNSGKIKFAYMKYGFGKKKTHLRAIFHGDEECSDIVRFLGETNR